MRASLFLYFLLRKYIKLHQRRQKLSFKMRTNNVPSQVLETTCSLIRVIKRFKYIPYSFSIVTIYAFRLQSSKKLLLNCYISLYLKVTANLSFPEFSY